MEARDDDRGDVREAIDGMAGGLDAIDGDERGEQAVAPGADLRDERRSLRGAELERRGHADRACDVLRSGAPVALLRPAVLLGQDVRAPADPQRARALGPFGLVGRQRDEVRAERVDVEIDPRGRLDRIDMK